MFHFSTSYVFSLLMLKYPFLALFIQLTPHFLLKHFAFSFLEQKEDRNLLTKIPTFFLVIYLVIYVF